MAAKKIKKIIIVGSGSQMAQSFMKANKDKYSFIKIGRKQKYNISHLLNNNLKNENSYSAIIYFIGVFKKIYTRINKNFLKINFLYLQNVLEYNYKSYLIKKRNIKFIVITSMDSICANPNSIGYSSMKSASSHLILNYQRIHKNTRISYFDIQPGGINTKMSKNKKGHRLEISDIVKTIDYILSLSPEAITLPIRIFPKVNNYQLY